ncbi:hypothetical protein [Bacillus phage vB_BanS-Thrax3]|nr:hypothetical protein [Bacillus phage vB_BanS-Thrax3]
MEKLSRDEFSKLMAKAFKTKEKYPNVSMDDIAILSCTEYQGRKDYGEILFQVTVNLVNAER